MKQAPKKSEITTGPLPPYNQLAIISFVLTFFVPVVGLVLAVIALNEIKKSGERGRGLAIASIIINIIMALLFIVVVAVLVFYNFETASARSRDAERKSDINALHSGLEHYYEQNGIYPTAHQFESKAWRQTHSGSSLVSYEAFRSPVTGEKYFYDVSGANCTATGCDSYMVSAHLENEEGPKTYSKSSLPDPNETQ